jgi:transcriptional regulator with XRE-family HTH domain
MAALEMAPVELATKSHVSLPYVSQLLSGQRANPRIPILRALARALGTTVADLTNPHPESTDVPAAS